MFRGAALRALLPQRLALCRTITGLNRSCHPLATSFMLRSIKRNYSHNTQSNDTVQLDDPKMMIAFTCKKCNSRSSHVFSKHSYYKGSVLIQCPSCKVRHLIADNLKMFRDNNVNIEELLKLKGENIAKDTTDLAFDDIPESLKGILGRHAKDAPVEYQSTEDADCVNDRSLLPESEQKK